MPTAIRHPRFLAGARVESVVELTDLTATILDAAGLDPRAALSKDWPAFNALGAPGRRIVTEEGVAAAGQCGENIAYGLTDARGVVLQLIVDDGVPGR